MLHMPDRVYDSNLLDVFVPSMWDWSPLAFGILALIFLTGVPVLTRWTQDTLAPPVEGDVQRLLRDGLLVCAVVAFVFVAQDGDPSEGAWYTSITLHVVYFALGLGAVLLVRRTLSRRGKTLPRNPYATEKYAAFVYAGIGSCVIAAVPAMVTGLVSKDAWGVLYLGPLVGFALIPWILPRVVQWANQAPALEEKVEDKIAATWGGSVT